MIISFIIGLLSYFIIIRPLDKISIRRDLKLKGYEFNSLKWYEWFL